MLFETLKKTEFDGMIIRVLSGNKKKRIVAIYPKEAEMKSTDGYGVESDLKFVSQPDGWRVTNNIGYYVFDKFDPFILYKENLTCYLCGNKIKSVDVLARVGNKSGRVANLHKNCVVKWLENEDREKANEKDFVEGVFDVPIEPNRMTMLELIDTPEKKKKE